MTCRASDGIIPGMNSTPDTQDTTKTRTRNVLSVEDKNKISEFVKTQMGFFFGSSVIGNAVSDKIVKDVAANVGSFSNYSKTHNIELRDMIAGLQKRILRSIGVHVEDNDILDGADVLVERAAAIEKQAENKKE